MFTGLIEEVGTVARIEGLARGSRLTIAAELSRSLREGDSIAVDGVCLTAVGVSGGEFVVEVSPETIARSNLAYYRIGTAVNLERPLSGSSRFGGHFVQGHVDATTRLRSRRQEGDFLRIGLAVPEGLAAYLVERGSVAVNGVSLTVAAVRDDTFEVQLIPHTLQHTNLVSPRRAEAMNVEVDILGKYVARFLQERLGLSQGPPVGTVGPVDELLGRRHFIEPPGEAR